MSFTDDEIKKLWSHVDDVAFDDVLLIQCYSGWRPQELGLLELSNVDLKNGSFIGGMKTESGTNRLVPIHSKIKHLVERRYKEAEELGSNFLFNYVEPNIQNKNISLTYTRYKSVVYRIRDDLQLNLNHRAHDGRNHFVTMAKKFCVDEYAIKYIVGHAIKNITEKAYTDRDFSWLQTEIEKIE